MRNRRYIRFWTRLGDRILDPRSAVELPDDLPPGMRKALTEPIRTVLQHSLLLGSPIPSTRARHVYQRTWKVLRDMGFSRPLRLEPWQGVTLFLPFFRNSIAVLPQAFSRRTPLSPRMQSLTGRTYAAALCGYSLWIVMARWEEDTIPHVTRGGLNAISLDRLDELPTR